MAGEPPSDWRKTTIRETVAYFASGDPFLKLEYSASGVPVLAKGDVKPFGRVEHGEKRFISESLVASRNYRTTQPGDYLLTTRDLTQAAEFLGLLAPIPHDRAYLVNQGANVVRFQPEVDGRYIVYWCNGPIYRAYVKGHHVGSTQIHIRKEDFFDAPLWLPPLSEQRAIARILGTLDDKIELNRRKNETLEEMARAIFKSWFVDFDPVRAKAEGRAPGLPEHVADLFPDRFEDSELGEIPAGWKVRSFAETVDILGGGTPKTSVTEYWGGDIPWYSVVDAPRDADVFVVDTEKKTTQMGVDNSSTRILPKGTSIISARGTVGRVALVGTPMAMNQSCYGLRDSDSEHGYYTYFATRNLVATLQQRVHGAVFDTITRDTLRGVSVVETDNALIEAFEIEVNSLMERILVNLQQSRTLASIRDTLLPKLISGELRVSNMERS